MKKILLLLTTCLLSFASFSQQKTGDLLLEGSIHTAWDDGSSGILKDASSLLGDVFSNSYGRYVTDHIAFTFGINAIVEKDNSRTVAKLGLRFHLPKIFLSPPDDSEGSLDKYGNGILFININPIAMDDDIKASWDIGIKRRIYIKEWLAFEPGLSIGKILPGTPVQINSILGVACLF